MRHIVYTLDTGKEYTVSQSVTFDGKAYETRHDVTFDLKNTLDKYSRFTADDGTLLITSHIVSAKIIDE